MCPIAKFEEFVKSATDEQIDMIINEYLKFTDETLTSSPYQPTNQIIDDHHR